MNDPQSGSGRPFLANLEKEATEICDQALIDAKMKLHPLLRNKEIHSLEERSGFVKAFKHALEYRIAEEVAAWEPDVDAIYRFDETRLRKRISWGGSIHLLVKIPRLSNVLEMFGKKLDQELLQQLQSRGWSCYRSRMSMLEIQQVTRYELQHHISFGAMFCAVYSVPMQIWPYEVKELLTLPLHQGR